MTNKKITVALSGNPNCGKSTIFNNLTGAKQHVGNYPGVTVEKKEGKVSYKDLEITFVDLPGTYSLSAQSEDEMVARDFIIQEKPDIVVHVIDSSNMERNLYLYTQLVELNVPLILAMNMTDVVKNSGQSLNYKKIAKVLGKPYVELVGNKNIGTKELLQSISDLQQGKLYNEKILPNYGEEIENEAEKISQCLENKSDKLSPYPLRWVVIKLIEKDETAWNLVKTLANGNETIQVTEQSRKHVKDHFGDDAEVIIADRRYGFISGACTGAIQASVEQRHDVSDKIDQVVLNRFFGLPIFALVMYLIFKFTFTVSEPVVGWMESLIEVIASVASSVIPEGLLQSLVVDGIIGGVGGVLGFFPLVLFMFFAIAFFEDTGYMARAAFVMDRIMSKFGLHGKSFLPMMISTNGCAVPGIMATRTLNSKKDRLITMLVTPFMICGAKLPIFALFIAAFFKPEHGTNLMFFMYILSIIIAFTSAWGLQQFVLKGETAHFVMELPPYRIPTMKGLLLKMWERGYQYLKKAGTIIVLIAIILWAGFTFPEIETPAEMNEQQVAAVQMEQSYAGRAGKLIEPLVKPIGMDWRGGIALLAGIAAKEVVVSTFGTIYSLGEVDVEETESLQESMRKDPFWTPLKAFSFLIFCLIYVPCFVAVAVFYRESGSSLKWTGFLIGWTTVMAWISSFIVYQGGSLLGF